MDKTVHNSSVMERPPATNPLPLTLPATTSGGDPPISSSNLTMSSDSLDSRSSTIPGKQNTTLGYPAKYLELLSKSLAKSKAMVHLSEESVRLAEELCGDDPQDLTSGRIYVQRNTRPVLQHGERTSLSNSAERLELSQGYATPDPTLFPKSRCTCKKSFTDRTLNDWSAFIVRPNLGALHASSLKPGERWVESITSCMREVCLRESLRRWKEVCLDGTPREGYWADKLDGVKAAVNELDDALLGSVDLPVCRATKSEAGGSTSAPLEPVDDLTARLVLPRWEAYDPGSEKFEETLVEWSGESEYRAPLLSQHEAPEDITEEDVGALRMFMEDHGVLLCAFRANAVVDEKKVEADRPRTLMLLRKDQSC